MPYTILVLNTGSTSTKLAVYRDEKEVLLREVKHSAQELAEFPLMHDQWPFREKIALDFAKETNELYGPFSAIVSRGGALPPVQPGGYIINEDMCYYLERICRQEHASNLAAVIADAVADALRIPHAYVYDPVSLDQLTPIARISGIPDLPRVSLTHALNMRAIAHKAAAKLGKPYNEVTLIVAHLGGGFSLSIHVNGRVVDMISDDEGPFSPERAGRQQATSLMKYLAKLNLSVPQTLKLLRGNSGLRGHLGTTDAREAEGRIRAGDEHARLVYEAMAYQIAKGVGELATVCCGKVDAVALTGGLAHSEMLTGWIEERVSFIAPVHRFPGENEMESLAHGALRILRGEETVNEFVMDPALREA